MNKIEKALKALDGMRQIVKNEMLVKGTYVSDEQDPEKSDAICHGFKYCAIGSLWTGYGVKPIIERSYGGSIIYVDLPGTRADERNDFVRNRPALKVALKALNKAATNYGNRHDLIVDGVDPYEENLYNGDAIEILFEENNKVGRKELLKVIDSAKRTLKAKAAA